MNKKLFLGIALNKQQSQIISQLQDHFGQALWRVPAANLHMTIAFFGPVSVEKQQTLQVQLAAIGKRRFSVTLDTLTYWQKPRSLCITGEADDKALLQIVAESQSVAAALGLHQSDHSFTPHITIARKAQRVPPLQLNFDPLILTPSTVHLFESVSGAQGVTYPILRSWDLQ